VQLHRTCQFVALLSRILLGSLCMHVHAMRQTRQAPKQQPVVSS
jgi:hypothetical protein